MKLSAGSDAAGARTARAAEEEGTLFPSLSMPGSRSAGVPASEAPSILPPRPSPPSLLLSLHFPTASSSFLATGLCFSPPRLSLSAPVADYSGVCFVERERERERMDGYESDERDREAFVIVLYAET